MTTPQAVPRRTPDSSLALGGDIERLPEFAARKGLTVPLVVEMAAAVAESLSHLHGQRRAHGAIVERNILVCDGQGWLAPPDRNQASAVVSDDVRQFGDLFRCLLARISDPEAAQAAAEIDALLERVPAAATPDTVPAVHGAGRQMKRVALGLKVLRARFSKLGPMLVERSVAAPASTVPGEENVDAPPAAPAQSAASGRRMVMLFRAVPEFEEAPCVDTAQGRPVLRLPWYAVMSGAALGTALLLFLLVRTLR